jgi:hypothetical protein
MHQSADAILLPTFAGAVVVTTAAPLKYIHPFRCYRFALPVTSRHVAEILRVYDIRSVTSSSPLLSAYRWWENCSLIPCSFWALAFRICCGVAASVITKSIRSIIGCQSMIFINNWMKTVVLIRPDEGAFILSLYIGCNERELFYKLNSW